MRRNQAGSWEPGPGDDAGCFLAELIQDGNDAAERERPTQA